MTIEIGPGSYPWAITIFARMFWRNTLIYIRQRNLTSINKEKRKKLHLNKRFSQKLVRDLVCYSWILIEISRRVRLAANPRPPCCTTAGGILSLELCVQGSPLTWNSMGVVLPGGVGHRWTYCRFWVQVVSTLALFIGPVLFVEGSTKSETELRPRLPLRRLL